MVANLFTGRPARNFGYEAVQALAKTVSFDTPGIGSADTVVLGALPSGAQIISCVVRVTTVFNAVTTNVLTVGATSTDNNVVAAGDVDELTAATTIVYRGCDLTFSSDTVIYVRYTQTGTAATTGAATIVLTYVVPANE